MTLLLAVEPTAVAPLSLRDRVTLLEDEMRKYPPRDIPLKHHFAKGIYAREVFLPADTYATGHIHKHEHLVVISQGDISMLTETGEWRRVQAPYTLLSPPGIKRLVYAHTDTVWTTFHPTDETDVAKLEAMLIAKTEHDYAAFLEGQSEQPKELMQCPS